MKVGDIFTDGGRTLKVIDMDYEGRPISTVISKDVIKEEPTSVEEATTPKRRTRKVTESV